MFEDLFVLEYDTHTHMKVGNIFLIINYIFNLSLKVKQTLQDVIGSNGHGKKESAFADC